MFLFHFVFLAYLWLEWMFQPIAATSERLTNMGMSDVPEHVLSSGVLTNPLVVGYTYESGIDPAYIPWNTLTHLILAFYRVDSTGNVLSTSNTTHLEAIVGMAHKNEVKVVASIGGYGRGSALLGMAMANNQTRQTLTKSLVTTIRDGNLDGVDYDYEFPETIQQLQNLYQALAAIRNELDQTFGLRNKTVSMTLYSSNGQFGPNLPPVDATPFSDLVDHGILMSYDYFGSFSAISAPNSPLYDVPGYPGLSFSSSILTWLQTGWDPKKLVAGLPYYGRTAIVQSGSVPDTQFMPTTGVAPPGGPVDKIAGAWTWTDLRDPKDGALTKPAVAQQGWQRFWDSGTETPWLFHNVSRTFIGYDDMDSLAFKTQYVITSGLTGVMVWMVQYDHRNELSSVVDRYAAACHRIAHQFSTEQQSQNYNPDNEGKDNDSSTAHSSKCSTTMLGTRLSGITAMLLLTIVVGIFV